MSSLLELNRRHIGVGERSVYVFGMSKAIKMQGGFKDTLTVGDDLNSRHGAAMQRIFDYATIPRENTVFFKRLGRSGGWRRPVNIGLPLFILPENEQLRKATKVVHLPVHLVLQSDEDLPIVQRLNMLFVAGAGNIPPGAWGNDRDLFNINHPAHNSQDATRHAAYQKAYRDLLEIRATGKVISANSMVLTESGEVQPEREVASCGDIKETCFTFGGSSKSTSATSARLSSMAFYLAQFWETHEEVVAVLNECAIDVGDPGVDREYGRGVANLLCPRVLKKEIEVVSAHLGDTEEAMFSSSGGDLEGVWQADATVLRVYLPAALKETLEIEYAGTLSGTVSFEGGTAAADFVAEAEVRSVFLLKRPIVATAENVVQFAGAYTTAEDTLHVSEEVLYTYETTRDSLHLLQSLTVREALKLLPDPWMGNMVDLMSPDFFDNISLQIRMSFARVRNGPPIISFEERETTRNTVTLAWDAKDANRYYITRYSDVSCTEVVEVRETAEKEITFSNLKADTSHYFTVEAKNENGLGILSDCLLVQTDAGPPADFNEDGMVNVEDFLLFVETFGTHEGDAEFDPRMDLDKNGIIGISDFLIFINMFGMTG